MFRSGPQTRDFSSAYRTGHTWQTGYAAQVTAADGVGVALTKRRGRVTNEIEIR
jgi:hypothetical protein